jgi:LuxR family transcriptional regulator, maltose regulon positive regulatory protein
VPASSLGLVSKQTARTAQGTPFAPPDPPVGMVPRADVLGRLSSPAMRVGVVTAPAGYGKTAHAAVLLRRDERPAAWIDLEDRHCDPRVLLTDLVAALHSVTDLDSDGLVAGGSSSDQFATELAPSLGRALQRCTKPFLLILDDVHLVGVPPASDLLEALIANVPPGSAVVLVGRACRLSALSRQRAEPMLVEIAEEALALEAQDVAEVLAGMGVSAGVEEANRLVADTEGWPVGVRLAGLATLAGVRRGDAPGLSGGEAAVLDYFDSEWLGNLTDDERDFLRRASVLDWMSGALCNAVLDRHDSGEVLHRICADRHLVIPLDRRESAYRMHGLLRDALATDFERRNSPAVREVHRRASSWFEAEGDIDRAVRHAVAAEDFDRTARLVVAHTPSYYTSGRYSTITGWVESIPHDRVVDSTALCLCGALGVLGVGDAAAVSVWLKLGESAAAAAPESDSLAQLCLLNLRCVTTAGPAGSAVADAAVAHGGLPPGIWHAATCLTYGAWSFMVGDDDVAAKVLAEGAAEAGVFGAIALEAYCTSVLAIAAHFEGDAARAWSLARRARSLAVEHGLERTPGMAIVSAVHALAAASTGDPETARADWQLARSQLSYMKDLNGWGNVQTRIALAQTSLVLADRVGAETMLRELRELLVPQPDATRAHAQIAQLEDMVRHLRGNAAIGASSLTTAELRVLHYLPTNLSLAEIGGRLFVSRYTVKTHCASIYRKLNATSRSEAVEAARRFGLLETAAVGETT